MKKIGKYTLLDNTKNSKYYFYPIEALNNIDITTKQNSLCILFDITNNTDLKSLKVKVLNKNNETVYTTYTLKTLKVDKNKYNIVEISSNKEINILNTIDFTTLDYDSFIDLLSNNKELLKIIPELKKQIEKDKDTLNNKIEIVKKLDIPNKINYYHNTTGYIIDTIEKLVTSEDEINLSNEILKNIKKSNEIILYNKEYCNIAYTSLKANVIYKIKTYNQKRTHIISSKDLKCDTDKQELSLKDLNTIIDSFIKNEKIKKELNIIQERINYELNIKPNIKSFTNHLKIILANDIYIDKSKRNRSIDENIIKDLICYNLKENNYILLPRNEVIIYNLDDNNIINFLCIISTDLIDKLLKSITIDINEKEYIELIKVIDNLKKNETITQKKNNIKILIYTLIMIESYYYKNISDKQLFFTNKQNSIDLKYLHNEYDISIFNKYNNRVIAQISKLTDTTKENIKNSLSNNKKEFVNIINNIILTNMMSSLSSFNINININDISHKDINIIFNRTLRNDTFYCNLTLDELLVSLTNAKIKISNKEIESDYIYGIHKKDYDYIFRKSKTISEIVESKKSSNKTYIKIKNLYNELINTKNIHLKFKIILDLAKLLEFDNIRIEEK